MEFWGHEVKPGITVSCKPGDGFIIHLSQVALCETNEGSENVVVFVKVGDQKLAIGTLSADKHPQILCDLMFGEAFELSHNSKTTSVFLCSCKAYLPHLFRSDSGEHKDEELKTDEIPVKMNQAQISAAKDGNKDKQDDDNESGDSETSSGTDDSTSGDDSETSSGTDDSTSEDDSSDEDDMSSETDNSSGDDSEDEETPVKPEVGKKRAVATVLKTPPSDKKAKISTPKKGTGDKKSVRVADGKQKKKAPKTTADSNAKKKSTKSGSRSCISCCMTLKITIECGK